MAVYLETAGAGVVIDEPGMFVLFPLPPPRSTRRTFAVLFGLPDLNDVAVFGEPLGTFVPSLENA